MDNFLHYSSNYFQALNVNMIDPEGATDALCEPGAMEPNPNRDNDAFPLHETTPVPVEQIDVYTAIHCESTFSQVSDDLYLVDGDSLSVTEDLDFVLLSKCKKFSVGIGVIIGFFIQLSCMGSVVLYNAFSAMAGDRLKTTENRIIVFSFIWSAATSLIGFVLMLALSRLLHQAQDIARRARSEHFMLSVELYIAVGAVAGVSMAWSAKDILSGGRISNWQTFFSFGSAIVYACVANSMVRRSEPSSTIPKLMTPLLQKVTNKSVDYKNFKTYSLLAGFLIGCLVQISSLATRTVFLTHGNEHPNYMAVSIVTDLYTSGLGVVTLLFIRRLLMLQYNADRVENLSATEATVVSHFESHFALGVLCGVNFAWIATDMILGLHYLIGKSLLALAASLLWCHIISPGAAGTQQDLDYEPDVNV